ncbi:MAG TPA: adenosine deaminase [Gammaproteobacteria bacterium]|jgi:adenosine deaminase|nr:adenosine deaminase [Gammaproteobacteria bacterium]
MNKKIQDIPKVELHSHLEGTIPPVLVRKIAKRNKIKLKDDLFTAKDSFAWSDFVAFLKAYDEASFCLRKSIDYEDITYEYYKSCAIEGTIYAETFISPDHADAVGINYKEMINGCARGIDRVEKEFDFIGRLIVSCVRHLGPDQAVKVARLMVDNPHPYVVGFGMGGNESMYTMSDFAPAYNIVSEAGYPCTVHAGEVCGPESVWDAINSLPISRIGHGVRSVEDDKLLVELFKRNIALEVCPGSNLALNVYPDWESHPLKHILESGISVSLNSDDPPFFNTSVGKEYQNAASFFDLSAEKLYEISAMAIEASFVDDQTKDKLIAKITG